MSLLFELLLETQAMFSFFPFNAVLQTPQTHFSVLVVVGVRAVALYRERQFKAHLCAKLNIDPDPDRDLHPYSALILSVFMHVF